MFKKILKVARQYRTVGLAIPITLLLTLAGSTALSGAKMTAHAEQEESNEQVFYYLHDHLGGIAAVLDEEGNVVERRDYLPFGKTREEVIANSDHPELYVSTSSAVPEDYGYTGKELDNETGLNYYGSRYYDSEIGRFTQIDPLVLGESAKSLESVLSNPQALNSYSYVTNNPLRYVDDEGEYGEDVHYTLTYYLALKSGLDTTTANEIAFFDDRVDTSPETAPRGNLSTLEGIKLSIGNVLNGTTKKYHFATKSDAWDGVKNALNSGSARKLGASLHTYQDSFSHGLVNLSIAQHSILTKAEEYASNLLGVSIGTDPDKTQNNVYVATQMAIDTFMSLRQYKLKQLNLSKQEDIDAFNAESYTILGNNIGNVINFLSSELKDDSNVSKETKENNK